MQTKRGSNPDTEKGRFSAPFNIWADSLHAQSFMQLGYHTDIGIQNAHRIFSWKVEGNYQFSPIRANED